MCDAIVKNFSARMLGILASLLLLGGGIGVIAAAPASAGPPRCDGVGTKEAGNQSVARIPIKTGDGWNCTLSEGSSGSAVSALQVALKQCYGADIAVDGQFGSRTKSALRSAQSKAGVGADGVYGPNTRNALKWFTTMHGDPKGCNRLT